MSDLKLEGNSLNKKIVFIVPYFGKLPDYFDLYLISLKKNKNFDLLLITDDKTEFNYPVNVKVIYMSFTELKEKFQEKFDFTISLDFGYKLCDYKPSLGYIFEDLIEGYDFWGHCDFDIVLGDLSKFITDNILNNHDKIFDLGHLTLYRNTYEINRAFMLPVNGVYIYKEVFKKKGFCRFDELDTNSINTIFDAHKIKRFSTSFCAEILRSRSNFFLIRYNDKTRSSFIDCNNKQVFCREGGSLFRIYDHQGSITKEEFAYIHMQKRSMCNTIDTTSKIEKFIIIPNKFIELSNNLTNIQLLKKYFKKFYCNRQFFVLWYTVLKNGYNNYGALGYIKRIISVLFNNF